MKENSFWVIERFENGKSQGYWAGDSSRDFIVEIDNAIHFCRKEDAWRIKRGWHWNDTQVTEHLYLEVNNHQPFRHHNGEIDFPNGDRVRWANGWWMADRKSGETTKHKTAKEAEAELSQ